MPEKHIYDFFKDFRAAFELVGIVIPLYMLTSFSAVPRSINSVFSALSIYCVLVNSE